MQKFFCLSVSKHGFYPSLVETAQHYFNLNKARNLKKLRRYLQDYLACSEKYCNLKAYYLLMLGILILCQIVDVTTKQAVVNAIGSICEDNAGGLSADNWKPMILRSILCGMPSSLLGFILYFIPS